MSILQKSYSFFNTDLGRVAIFILITLFFHKLWWFLYADFSQVFLIAETQKILANIVFEWSYFFDKQILALDVEINSTNRSLLFEDNAFIQISKTCSGL